jgi:hypothetical protein
MIELSEKEFRTEESLYKWLLSKGFRCAPTKAGRKITVFIGPPAIIARISK